MICFLKPQSLKQNIFKQPYNFKTIEEYQQKDAPLKQRINQNPTDYKEKQIKDATIIIKLDNDQTRTQYINKELTNRCAIINNN